MRRRSLLCVILLCLSASAALATVVLEVSIERLSERADLILRGRVTDTTVLLERGAKRIWTRHRVQVDETLAGAAGTSVLVHVRGGRVGRLAQTVKGTAQPRKGERVVLFLWKDSADRLRVLGQAQGLYRITTDEESGTQHCRSDVSGLALIGADGRPATSTETGRGVELAELRKRVAAARAAKARREEAARRKAERKRRAAIERAREIRQRTRGKPGSSE
jgi:hypothetical protein